MFIIKQYQKKISLLFVLVNLLIIKKKINNLNFIFFYKVKLKFLFYSVKLKYDRD